MLFRDRTVAGRRLAGSLEGHVSGPVVVLALPRGGVPVAAEVARALGAPLDVIGVRKVGMPGHPELGVGAVSEGGGVVIDAAMLDRLGLRPEELAPEIAAQRREVERVVARFRGDRPLPDLRGQTVVLVDDGLATGVTAKAAVRAVRNLGAARVLLAVPVCSDVGRDDLAVEADVVVCEQTPERFMAVGQWYDDFRQVGDDEVLAALGRARAQAPSS